MVEDSRARTSSTFNRTSLELKPSCVSVAGWLEVTTFNRTSLELKLASDVGRGVRCGVLLIAPVWN